MDKKFNQRTLSQKSLTDISNKKQTSHLLEESTKNFDEKKIHLENVVDKNPGNKFNQEGHINISNKEFEHENSSNTDERKINCKIANYKKLSGRELKKGLLSIFCALLILLSGCSGGSAYSSIPTIEGRGLGESSQAIDEQNKQNVIVSQSQKYARHFKAGLYYADYSKEQAELNALYKKHIRKEIDKYINEKAPLLKGVPYALQTDIEYVKQDLKNYAEGKVKAEEIVDNPNSIMKVTLRGYMFKKHKEEDVKNAIYSTYDYYEDMVAPKYIANGVEYVDVAFFLYSPTALGNMKIEDLEKEKNIKAVLKEKSIIYSTLNKTYFKNMDVDYEYDSFSDFLNLVVGSDDEDAKERLNKKYNIEFDNPYPLFFYPRKYPDIKFSEWYFDDEISFDNFKVSMFQYLANQRVRKIIEDAGLSDRVVFLVTARPQDREISYTKPYNFGKGFDENFYLREGFTGDSDFTFIYLEDKNKKEGLTEEQIEQKKEETFKMITEKIITPLNGVMDLGELDTRSSYKGQETPDKMVYFYKHYVDDYDRKVIVDLFKKYPLTEVDSEPDGDLSDVFSLRYTTRAETPGFHYLDIFGEEVELFSGYSITELDKMYDKNFNKNYYNLESED